MAPDLSSDCTGILNQEEYKNETQPEILENLTKLSDRKLQIVWKKVIIFVYLHLSGVYGLYLIFTSAKLPTTLLAIFLCIFGMFGVTAGAHRLWSHRAYKAKWQLKLVLIIANTIAFQDPIYYWARDHRLHHKYSETDADPHNAKRGFFFSHIGWLMCRKHPLVAEKGKHLDISDLIQDPFIINQKRYYKILVLLLSFAIPTFIPWCFWNETLSNAWFLSLCRYAITLNFTWLVNSAAHIWGYHPYDKYINPSQVPFVSFLAIGEGWHNYHHVFPWDYKASELGSKFNTTTHLINLFAKIGWAYDLKTVSDEMIHKRVLRTGDGSHEICKQNDTKEI